MPYSYSIDTGLQTIFVTAEGKITDTELLTVIRAFNSDTRFHPDMRLLADYTRVTENRLSSEGMMECARLSKFSPESRRIVLVTGNVEFGMFRVYESYCLVGGKTTPAVVRDRAQALEFLNVGVPPEKRIT